LPGWSEKIARAFAAFPELGQLSVFGPVPTDDEAWDDRPINEYFLLRQWKGKWSLIKSSRDHKGSN
jgi:hypothetical protein